MAQSNNTLLNLGAGGDTMTTVDQTSFAAYPATGKIPTACLYNAVDTSTVPTPVVKANPLYVRQTDGTNVTPAGDAIARAVVTKITDGTTAIAVDAVSGGLKEAGVGPGTPLGVSAAASAASNNQTLSASASKITHATGFLLSGLGAAAASNISVTLSDGTWTLTFSVPVPAGATAPMTPFPVSFATPLAASAANTTIVLTVPSYGAGNTSAVASLWGFKV